MARRHPDRRGPAVVPVCDELGVISFLKMMSGISSTDLVLSEAIDMGIGLSYRMWRVKTQPFLGWHRRRLRRLRPS
jgi:hypothetical protein